MRRAVWVMGIVVSGALAYAAPASATNDQYFASPLGSGTCLTTDSPCSIYAAASMAGNTDSVELAGGTYELGMGILEVKPGATLEAQIPGTFPRLHSPIGDSVYLHSADSTIRGVVIDAHSTGSDWALRLQPGTADQVAVIVDGSLPLGVITYSGAALKNSSVWATGSSSGGSGITVTGDGGAFRNVTSVADNPFGIGLASNSVPASGETITLENSIVRGTYYDIDVSTDPGHPVTVNATSSNYATTDPLVGAVTDLGGNQTASPVFVDAATGDFRQQPTSQTIDHGAALLGLGDFDLSGGPRVVGSAPDIGADEYDPPPSPAVTGGASPAGSPIAARCKTKKKHAAAAKAKRCRKKRKK